MGPPRYVPDVPATTDPNLPQPTRGITLDTTGITFADLQFAYNAIPPRNVRIDNAGNQATGQLAVALSGDGADSFALSTASIPSIAAGESTTFTVGPNHGLAVGTHTATVTVSGGSGITARSFTVSFTVTEGPPEPTFGISLNVTGVFMFASVTPREVRIDNEGNQPTGPLTVALSGNNAASFVLSAALIPSIAAHESAAFTVVPNHGLAVGTHTATVTVSGGSGITAQSFTVSFTINPTVTFQANGGSPVPPQQVQEGQPVGEMRPPAPTRSNFIFNGWFTDNGTFQNRFNLYSMPITGDITLYAKWLPDSLLAMSPIPAGTLTRGGHIITLDAFYMMVFEVTQDLFHEVMGFNPSHFTLELGWQPASGEVQGRRPVEMVTWFDAVYFANRLSIREGLIPAYTIGNIVRASNGAGRGYRITSATVTWNDGANGFRLPTEAEWDYASHAGGDPTWNWHFGNAHNRIDDYAWHFGNSRPNTTRQVGRRQANAWGLHDMHGNVWEKVWDWYNWTFPDPANLNNPRGPVTGSYRMQRGGCFDWPLSAGFVHFSYRRLGLPDFGHMTIGFRLVRP